MSSIRPQDRASLCTFTFADGRRCRMPLSSRHPRLCFDHARKKAKADKPKKPRDYARGSKKRKVKKLARGQSKR